MPDAFLRERNLSQGRLIFGTMKKKRTPQSRPVTDLTVAIAALAQLGVEIVERCPEPDCSVCGPMFTVAA